MNQRSLFIVAAASCLTLGAVVLIGNRVDSISAVSPLAAVESACIWNHYVQTAPTETTNGSKEFWACCAHPGTHVFEEPTEGTINPGDHVFEGVYDLTSDDDRYLAPY